MAIKKKRPGRPKLPKAERLSSTVIVRMSNAERKVIDAAADSAGEKLSEWIRATLIGAAEAGRLVGEERKVGESNSGDGTSTAP
jgi:hypothetical protein